MNWLALIEFIIGAGEKVIPNFIHNPKSQQIEAVIFTDTNNAMSLVNQVVAANPNKTVTAPPAK